MRSFQIVAFMLASALCLGCSQDEPTRLPAKNVIIIVVDTLRADRLAAYGSERQLTPFIDSLAERGFVFRNAYATSPWTSPSVASIFTSRYQSQHRVLSFRSSLASAEITLAETLRERGLRTGAFCANFLLNPKYGYRQGFEKFKLFAPERVEDRNGTARRGKARAASVNLEALKWLDTLDTSEGQPGVFLYLHYMEPHNPYQPESEFIDPIRARDEQPDLDKVNALMRVSQFEGIPHEMALAVEDFYDAEVMSLDSQIRQLFASLAARSFLDDTIVVITSDHGEEFQEHGGLSHGQTLYEETIRIPLIVLVPGHSAGVEIERLASLIDVAPTVLDFTSTPIPASFEGRSLRNVMGLSRQTDASTVRPEDPLAADRDITFSESIRHEGQRHRPHERAIMTDAGKLILGADQSEEFYDLVVDPGETKRDALDEEARSQLSAAIAAFAAEMERGAGPDVLHELDAETAERLRALGYIE